MVTLHIKAANGIHKVRGLIGASEPESIVLKTRFGIHTFGLRFPIDLAVLDHNGVVQTTRKGFKPNGIFLWSPRYNRILELPVGTLEKKQIKKGVQMTLVFDQK